MSGTIFAGDRASAGARSTTSRAAPAATDHDEARPDGALTDQRASELVESADAPHRDPRAEQQRLLWLLRTGDAIAVALGFVIALAAISQALYETGQDLVTVAAATVIGLGSIRFEGLWNPRVTAMRTIEISKLARAVAILGIGVLVLDRVRQLQFHIEHILVSCALSWVLLLAWRSFYRAWLAHQRRKGAYTRRLVIVGTDRRALDLARIFQVHPEAGMRIAGVVGSRREAEAAGLGASWLGTYADADEALDGVEAEVVVICTADINPLLMNSLLRDEEGRGRELYFHPGLSGIDAGRVKASPIAHEPLLYVESMSLSKFDLAVKRVFDVVVASVLLVVTAPVMLVVAWWIRREDGGPVFFRQQRVGQNDVDFGMIKFRTMGVDAEARLASLQTDNQRSGPLFKLGVDPRVTRIGRVLRATSLDELPQLLNVVKGEMSLVGPRPALRSEVAAFPIELHQRHRVRPGITGLWQVEARDNPAFDAYQRLDLFYVENWSLALDLVILLATAEQMLLRPFLSRARGEMAAPAAVTTSATAA